MRVQGCQRLWNFHRLVLKSRKCLPNTKIMFKTSIVISPQFNIMNLVNIQHSNLVINQTKMKIEIFCKQQINLDHSMIQNNITVQN